MDSDFGLSTAQFKRLQRIRVLSRLLDSVMRVPGTSIRIGLDGIIGLVPGVGDVLTAGVSAYLIHQSSKLGVPRPVLARMIANVGLDLFGGMMPVVGDLFDVAWKANLKNLALLEEYLELRQRPQPLRPSKRRFPALFGRRVSP